MILQLSSTLDVSKNFDVPPDLTVWQPKDYLQTAQGWTPKRDRASYASWQKSVVPTTQDAHKLKNYFGIYTVAFEVPETSLYIGITSNDTKMSEVVLNRFNKHRVRSGRNFAQQRFTALNGRPARHELDVLI